MVSVREGLGMGVEERKTDTGIISVFFGELRGALTSELF
jgi:hypothetical protein